MQNLLGVAEKGEPITQDSNSIVKRINGSWSGASSALKDLSTHNMQFAFWMASERAGEER